MRLRSQIPALLAEKGWFEAIAKIENDYAIPLACLERLDTAKDTLPIQAGLRAAGCLTVHLGDAYAAVDGPFDAMDDAFPEDLMGQYYLVFCQHEFFADVSATLSDALDAARDYAGQDPEQHYYAARIFHFANLEQDACRALERAGDYRPALFLRFEAAMARGDAAAMDALTGQILALEKAATGPRRFLRCAYAPLDLTTPAWLDDVLHWAKQCELAPQIQTFLAHLQDERYHALRSAYHDVLPETYVEPLAIIRAWKLNAPSQRQLEAQKNARYIVELEKVRRKAELTVDNFHAIDSAPDDKLEEDIVTRLSLKDLNLEKELTLIYYFRFSNRLDQQTAFLLRLYAIYRKSSTETTTQRLTKMLLLTGTTGFGSSYISANFVDPFLIGLASGIASSILTGAAEYLIAKHALSKHRPQNIDYKTFKSDLKKYLSDKKYNIPKSILARFD